jgi:hypothetical protein
MVRSYGWRVSADPVFRRTSPALPGSGVASLVMAICPQKTVAIDSIATIPVAGGSIDVEMATRAIADGVQIKASNLTEVQRSVADVICGHGRGARAATPKVHRFRWTHPLPLPHPLNTKIMGMMRRFRIEDS